ncbi:MAG: hypothetical protein HFG54_11405 [Lachnospiraceae bacterium]|nr:hypothetical protein [Lachnospiraceae bacterium]
MKQDSGIRQLNTRQIEMHLKSALDTLTPNVLDRIDLSVHQDELSGAERQSQAAILRLERRMRGFVSAAAVCVCLIIMGGGAFHYHLENRQVESVIGIDVNPSIEISINRRERVLETRALNADGEAIISDMDLEGVDLNVAVNAVVGSMVTQGYLDDLDNAILVTVSNDSVRKAKELRTSVVGDIEQTLKENQVEAVVYDQQVIEDEEIKEISRQYGISYGKAYFLKELIDQNAALSMEDMEEMSAMTMEQIARRIGESSYELGELAGQATAPETTAPETSTEETSVMEMMPQESATEASIGEESQSSEESSSETEKTTAVPETATNASKEELTGYEAKIDYVDCEDGIVYVYFKGRVKWKNPSVVVRDGQGNTYAAMIIDTSSEDCSFEVAGLEGGESCTFVLAGLSLAGDDASIAVKGYFDAPEIAWGAGDDENLRESDGELPDETKPSETEDLGQPGLDDELLGDADTESKETLTEVEESTEQLEETEKDSVEESSIKDAEAV